MDEEEIKKLQAKLEQINDHKKKFRDLERLHFDPNEKIRTQKYQDFQKQLKTGWKEPNA